MVLVWQIILGVALLTGLVTIVLSTKIWHWTQVTLVSFIMLFGIVALFFGAEVYRIHRNLRSGLLGLENRLATANAQTERLLQGTDDSPGIRVLEQRLQMVSRQRGRVWRGVEPTGGISPEGMVEVTIATPQPHRLEEDAVVYAFEAGNPIEGAQYLGEFRVSATAGDGVTLEPTLKSELRSLERLDRSRDTWTLYETMPADRHNLFSNSDDPHEIFADLSEEQLRELLPESTVEEYIRHGQDATDDDDPIDIIFLDDNGNRVDPDEAELAVKKLYNRPLRDYGYLFGELDRQRIVVAAEIQAVVADNIKTETSLASAKKLSKFRQEEIDALEIDLKDVQTEQEAMEAHRDQVLRGLSGARKMIESLLAKNAALARQYQQEQQQLIDLINFQAPAPAAAGIPLR